MANEYLDLTGLTTYDTKLKTEMSTDYVPKTDIIDNLTSDATNKPLSAKQGKTLKAIVEGKPHAYTTGGIVPLVNDLNAAPAGTFSIGTSLYLWQLNVPDFWVIQVSTVSNVPYTYVSDQKFIDDVIAGGSLGLQIGYHFVSILETEKVDLTNLVPDSRTIAGKSLAADITKAEMQTALNVADGANNTVANSKAAAGTVAAGGENANKVWKTDGSGNPAWRDDADSTYSAGNGLSLSSGAFAAKPKTNGGIKVDGDGISLETGYVDNAKNYKVQVDANGKPFVNVPWTDNNTWTANSQAAAGYVAAGGANNNKVWKTDGSGNPAWRDEAADTDTKNTAGTTNKVGVKMFLVGAESQGANPQTFSNSNVYIDTNNKLCSNGNVVLDSSDLTPITELQIASLFE